MNVLIAEDDAIISMELEERLQRQFSALEQTLAELQSQSEFLENQLYNLGNVFAYQRNGR